LGLAPRRRARADPAGDLSGVSPRPPRPKSRPQAIGELVNRVLADLGAGATARAVRIADRWEEAVGAEIARHSQPVAIRGDVLEVSVDASVWCQQLQLRTPEILAALRRVVGEDAPAEMWLYVG
jgi:predicted nucleic acid-binding Zn ribbon protein